MHHRHLKTSILRVVQIWETQNLSTSVAGRVFLQTWRILLLFFFIVAPATWNSQSVVLRAKKERYKRAKRHSSNSWPFVPWNELQCWCMPRSKDAFLFNQFWRFGMLRWVLSSSSIESWRRNDHLFKESPWPTARCRRRPTGEDRLDLTVANQVRWQPSLDKVILG